MDAEENKLLTQVGPGTPMGEVLRRHWFPIAGASEFAEQRVKPVRFLGEDLVLYKDLSGNFGLVDNKCAHRRADLSYGFVEKCGLRCSYHGWAFDETGQCTEMPYEDTVAPNSKYKSRVKIKAYPVKELGGMLWTYMGPMPAPELPVWEPFTWPNGFRQIVIAEVPCNWLQGQENSCDPVHFEWNHMNWGRRLENEESEHGPKHTQLAFDEFEYGLIYRRVREDTDEESPLWTVGRVCLWPHAFFLGDHIEWRIPIDDENLLSIAWMYNRVPQESEPFVQDVVPTWRSPIVDPETGRWYSTHVFNQDFIAWMGQGRIADRTKEKLGLSDRGIQMLRRRLLEDVEKVQRGEDPSAIIRDPEVAKCVILPAYDRDKLLKGGPLAELKKDPSFAAHLKGFLFQAGQPPEVWDAFCEAMAQPGTKTAEGVRTAGLGKPLEVEEDA